MLLDQNIKRLKRQYMLITFAIVVLSVSLRLYYENRELEKQFQQQLEYTHEKIHLLFQSSLNALENQYFSIVSCYMHTPEIVSLIKKRDVKELHNRIVKDYQALLGHNQNLYTMHFIDAKNSTILRMHNPSYYDDDLTQIRPMVRVANETKKLQKGFEVGKHGITYRLTYPLMTPKGEYLGVLEFGLRPAFFSSILKENFDVETEILVLNENLKVVESKTDYPKFGIYSILQGDAIFSALNSLLDLEVPSQMLSYKEQTYIADSDLNLESFDAKVLSKIIVLKDVTQLVQEKTQRMYINNLLNFGILILLWGVVYVILTTYTKKITALQRNNRHLKYKENRLKNRLNLDALTTLYNRGYLEVYYEHLFLKLPSTSVACSMMDIDFFKNVNDEHGHLVGDQVLMIMATLARSFFRNSDVIVRYGGEEFIMFMENISYEKGCQKLEEFRKLIEKYEEFPHGLRLTMSFGFVMVDEDEHLEKLIHRVDTLLYQAKERGRNQIVCDKRQDA